MAFATNNYPLLRYPRDSPLFPTALYLPQRLSAPNPTPYAIINPKVLRLSCRKRAVPMNCQTTAEKRIVSGDRMLVYVPPHPLIKHWISVLRNEQTPCPIFKNAMAELGRLLIYEASRDWLPTISGEIQSPMGAALVEFVDPRDPMLKEIVPILRAGLALAEHASSVLPATKTYHLGGTVVAAVQLIKDRGVDNKQIKVIFAVAAPPALQKLSEKFPGLHVYAGILDPKVDDKGFKIPGLGDAGDRSFGII